MLKDLRFGNDGKLEKFGISMLPNLLIRGMQKPSKLSKPVKGDCNASVGSRSDEVSESPEDDDGDDDDETGVEMGDDVVSWLFGNNFSSILEFI